MAESTSMKTSSIEKIEKIENEIGGKPSQNGQDEPKSESPDEEAQAVSPRQSIDGRTKLQDQSNLLPMKQLIVVFAGLSCALFCEFKSKHL
jgi:hypothetical protein